MSAGSLVVVEKRREEKRRKECSIIGVGGMEMEDICTKFARKRIRAGLRRQYGSTMW